MLYNLNFPECKSINCNIFNCHECNKIIFYRTKIVSLTIFILMFIISILVFVAKIYNPYVYIYIYRCLLLLTIISLIYPCPSILKIGMLYGCCLTKIYNIILCAATNIYF